MTALRPEHFRAIADFTYDWETWVGPSGEVLWVNPAVERITGYSAAECLHMSGYPLPLVCEEDRPRLAELLARAAEGASGNHHEFRVLRKDGTICWAAISFQPLGSATGEHLGYRSSVRDIHERKQLEERLRDALVLAEAANRAKSEFLANVSHELRTPLQSILGYAELLAAAQLPAPLSAHVKTLLEQGQLLDRLVADLLDHASLAAGLLPLRPERHDPRAALAQVVRACAPLAARKGLSLELDVTLGPEQVTNDPGRMCQVASNLINNALKFTERGRVHVCLTGADDLGRYRIIVDDTGPGMPADESLFEPFRQGHSGAAPHAGGVGLGLAISRQLCERMGGSLVSEPGPLGGARFVATLPLAMPDGAVRATEPLQAALTAAPIDRSFAARHPLRVLVVDDVAAAREFVQAALGALGYEAAQAETAERAFALTQAQRFELVLIDIQMPLIDGWSAARGLRQRLGPEPLLVALTADARAGEPGRLLEAGFDGFVQKPVRLEQLQTLLVRAHERARRVSSGLEAVFDAQRWRELAAIPVGSGTLLDQMRRRVSEALPAARARAHAAAPGAELGRALHELHGLLALIGASRACALLREGEPRAHEGKFSAADRDALEAELALIAAALSPAPGVASRDGNVTQRETVQLERPASG